MEIRDLNYFRAVVGAGGVTNAAGLLHMSPGAVSRAIRRFEEEVGHQLLKRSGRNLVLTEVGRRLYERSDRLLEEHQSLLTELDSAAAPSPGMLRMASLEIYNTHFMGHLLEHYLPDEKVEILEVLIGDIGTAVLERRVDYGITDIPFPNRDLAFRRLGRAEGGLFGRPGVFDGMPFEEIPFVVPANPMRVSGKELTGIDGWPQSRLPRNAVYRVTLLQSGIELAARGKAMFLLPIYVAALHNAAARRSRQLVRYPLPPGLPRMHWETQLVCLAERRNDPRTKQLASVLRRALTEVCAIPVPSA
jgi:DNA-binding transcriptional LysR family regulator